MHLRYILIIISFFFSFAIKANELETHPIFAGGYQEAVFSVSDIEAQVKFYTEVAGWEILSEGNVSQRLIEAYSLPKNTNAREVVMGNSGTKRGFIRLIEFVDVDQVQIRSSAQSWDTGGIFDVNFRVLSMQEKFKEMQKYDWQSASDPVEFSFGPFVVKEWLPRGPDGIVFAMIERVQPPLEGWPNLREMSRLFNATQVVADIEEAKDFYIDKLGFKIYLEHKGASSKEGPNVLGLPHNLTTKIDREVYILHPTGVNEGSVEILSFDGAVGRDFSALAVPPNLGILMLRFPVYDIDDIHQLSIDKNIEVIFPPMKVGLDPYGEIDLMAVKGPGGVWLEFYENND
ncbi:MAG: VOC family protein [Gammaproteobacteria bacterium]|nr:MAG: VOC family protein [Gammaproteobacteria bacterium]|tara:strand:+ start:1085 stop:2119 length:1035 start_codon:yes stop_codon:yes gene_type:complete